nr:glycosyl hydrolase 108 family protein [Burkholderia multivorans]
MDQKIDELLGREGKFSDDPNDRGNWYLGKLEGTMWGITAAEARAFGYTGPMNQMPRWTAAQIYKQRYWLGPKLDQVAAIDEKIADRLFDIGVNAGQATGVKFLQRALNVLNRQGKDFPDITVDGGIGPITLSALRAFLSKRGKDGRDVLFFMIASQHSTFYIDIAEKRPANEDFEYGWQINRAMNGVKV